ncbi:hypothetical protein F5887DRAFT_1288454 [Amanita rubescens]|nr:hypothetical protein F5887DRAFT_1288454 [Amanita rubescens]
MSSIISEANFIRLFTKAFLLGAYLVSFFVCLRWLVFSDDGGSLRKGRNRPTLIVAIIFFALSLADFGLGAYSKLSHGAGTWVYDIIVKVSSTIMIDCTLIFRCWIIYNKSWRITVLPLILLLYNVSCLPMLTYWSCGDPNPRAHCRQIRLAFFTSTIILNIYATAAIIWKISRNSISLRRFRYAIRVIVESGLLYTLASVATLFALLSHNPGPFKMATTIGFPVSGIAYNLILIRVAQNRAEHEDNLPSFINGSTIERNQPRWKKLTNLVTQVHS